MVMADAWKKSSLALCSWYRDLPDELQFIGPDSSGFEAGFLHLCSIPVSFLLRRPFFGRSYELDRHSSFLMTFEHWQELYARSQEAILWVNKNVSVIEDWFPPLYSLIVCALIQVSPVLLPNKNKNTFLFDKASQYVRLYFANADILLVQLFKLVPHLYSKT